MPWAARFSALRFPIWCGSGLPRADGCSSPCLKEAIGYAASGHEIGLVGEGLRPRKRRPKGEAFRAPRFARDRGRLTLAPQTPPCKQSGRPRERGVPASDAVRAASTRPPSRGPDLGTLTHGAWGSPSSRLEGVSFSRLLRRRHVRLPV